MPHHGNEAEHAAPQENPEEGAPLNGGEPTGAGAEEDALAQAEEILNAAGEAEGVEAAGEGAPSSQEGGASAEAEELRGDLLRLQAEYVNYRKRVERDRQVAGENAKIAAFTALLPVLDDIAAAREHGDLTEGPFASIASKLETALEGQGLESISGVGEAFDPAIHEALMQVPNEEVPADHVAQVLRLGYRKGERVLRAAQVIVSTGA